MKGENPFISIKKASLSEGVMNGPVGSLCRAPDVLRHAPEGRRLVITFASTCVSCDHL